MENSSKALIIAGSILIVIFLTSITILIVNSTSGTAEQMGSNSESFAIQSENSTFTNYFGSSVKGSQVKSLIQNIIVFNSENTKQEILLNLYEYTTSSTKKKAVTTHKKSSADLQSIYAYIESSANYEVQATSGCKKYKNGYTNNGRIGCISITKLYE